MVRMTGFVSALGADILGGVGLFVALGVSAGNGELAFNVAAARGSAGFGAGVVVTASAVTELGLVCFSDATGVAIRKSCALNTCKQEPQRTAPLADCS